MQEYELEFRNVTKRFGTMLANDHISFGVKKGEVHALIGENGAGKSTLMNCLYGMHRMDDGVIFYQGKELHLTSPKETMALGIGMVHQHFMLSPSLTVGENIVLGCKPSNSPIWDKKKLQKRLEETLADMDFEVPLDAVVRDLSVGMMQRVEIVKTLYRGAKLIILDEPTAVLTPQETEELFVSIRKLKERGHTVIFISHKLKEVMEISDRITVLRAGKTVGTVNKEDVTGEDLAQMMIGRQLAGMERETVALANPPCGSRTWWSWVTATKPRSMACRSSFAAGRSWAWPAWRGGAGGGGPSVSSGSARRCTAAWRSAAGI